MLVIKVVSYTLIGNASSFDSNAKVTADVPLDGVNAGAPPGLLSLRDRKAT